MYQTHDAHSIDLGIDLRAANQSAADHNRDHFLAHQVYVLNLMSAPGAGKTTLLERTIDALAGRWRMAVIEGDVQSRADAERIEQRGVPVVQINTGGACHLDARLIHDHLGGFDLSALDLLVIENVGNLVCPAEFDLGEHDKVMLLSVTEGHDKPEKYPLMFHAARAMLLTKIDLLPHVDFDPDLAERRARALNRELEIFRLSARTGAGLDAWCRWLEARVLGVKGTH
ncbi:hydrogenase nickel incorporation protein HypB [Haliangium sp.]|uniref:hydrogenase nickel incorporation protein HypB n=1 Tax=Haliangium sp. TaxID=2663208 RepID=UPI003D0E9D1C